MGLDIFVYTDLVPATGGEARDEDGDLHEDFLHVWNYDLHADRAEGLESKYYQHGPDQPCHHFRAGSYGSYNQWRENLAALAGYPAPPLTGTERPGDRLHSRTAWAYPDVPMPFRELVCFSDCEGTIGPVAAAKLAGDFAAHRDRAILMDEMLRRPFDNDFLAIYDEFHRAFKTVADAGGPAMVVFG